MCKGGRVGRSGWGRFGLQSPGRRRAGREKAILSVYRSGEAYQLDSRVERARKWVSTAPQAERSSGA